jgi:DNA-binding transcriptional regulator GbsR (MarR family)
MNAVDFRSSQKAPASGLFARHVARTSEVRSRFVANWGRMAATFGMPGDLGRVHAQLFIADGAVDVTTLARELDLDIDSVRCHLGSLLDWGVVRSAKDGFTDAYVTARDPWDFFLEIVRQRHKREFMPILELVRETASIARQLGSSNAEEAATRARVEAFSKFVEDLSRLIEVFVRVGSKPMALALKTFAKMAPRAA